MKKYKAFTLIELIITLAIIAIIISIAEINYFYVMNSAKLRCAASNGEEIYNAMLNVYAKDNNTIIENDLIDGVKDIVDENVTITKVEDKKVTLEYLYDEKTYSMLVDFSKEQIQITDKDTGRCISN